MRTRTSSQSTRPTPDGASPSAAHLPAGPRPAISSTRCEVVLPSPVGPLRLVAEDDALAAVEFMDRSAAAAPGTTAAVPEDADFAGRAVLARAREQLLAYFAGERRAFDLPLRARGTPFQERVWTALREIPYGETRSYADVARAIGRPSAVRAVGAANGQNPIAIVVPCHRVIGASGTLTGYAGGLERKSWLLQHERAALASGQLALL